ncbi:MAG: J domain-containing protein [Clostridia bacterium]|nr:J domain-containing protein [Clostridia bacterium]
MDAFGILNISRTATKEEIRAAYRALARRWHPDRFAQGPERDWANEKMAEINAAYKICLNENKPSVIVDNEESGLEEAAKLIESGAYDTAKLVLGRMTTRCAEWNYLFGRAQLRVGNRGRAKMYLSFACQQAPDNKTYKAALAEANPKKRRLF